MNIFVIESPNPIDLLEGRNEADSIVSIGKMFNHKATSFFVKDKVELNSVLKYLADVEADKTDLFCYHFSCHGNENGLAFGPDFLNWTEFSLAIDPFLKNKTMKDKYFLILSACGANEQDLTKKISKLDDSAKASIAPPSYIFVYDETEVYWRDALLSWTILYHRLGNVKKIDKDEIQDLLEKMKNVEFGKLLYFRWDDVKNKYLRFPPSDK